MIRKLTLLAAAIAVVALAVPALASASSVKAGGSLLAPGTAIVGSSSNATTETALGTLECENVTIQGSITTNSGGTVAGKGTGGSTAGCEVEGTPFEVTNPTLRELKSTTSGTGTVTLSFLAHVFGIPCTFETNAAVPGVFHYVLGSDTIEITPTPVEGACGEGSFEGDFTLTTAGGTPLELF